MKGHIVIPFSRPLFPYRIVDSNAHILDLYYAPFLGKRRHVCLLSDHLQRNLWLVKKLLRGFSLVCALYQTAGAKVVWRLASETTPADQNILNLFSAEHVKLMSHWVSQIFNNACFLLLYTCLMIFFFAKTIIHTYIKNLKIERQERTHDCSRRSGRREKSNSVKWVKSKNKMYMLY